MLRVAVDMWIGNAVAVLSGCWGAVTRRTPETRESRPALYTHAQRVAQAVASASAGGGRDETLWADTGRRRAANEARWDAWGAAAQPAVATPQPVAATAGALGLRLGQLRTVWAVWWPHGRGPSRATVGRWVAQASRKAGGRLAVREPHGQRWVLGRCVEAICFPREPILMAVEPHSMAWMAGQRGPERSGDSW
jgi:hypothetical protein